MFALSKGQILRYFLLPEILPNIRKLFGGGFGHVAFFIAHIYRAARLLPAFHPYLNPDNVGRFGIRHVIAEAANNLKLRRGNLDQILIFFTILLGIVILFMQVAMLLLGVLFVSNANAAIGTAIPIDFFDYFKLNPASLATHDIAYVLMDMVFGVPDLFNSCVTQGAKGVVCFQDAGGNNMISGFKGSGIPYGTASTQYDRTINVGAYPFPTPFHQALHSMMQFYSIGLLIIAMLIFLYFIIAVVAETAQEGTPFGRRFNKVWAPLRMVIALGLLIPMANGLNAAQYIVLYSAKFGSNFATNGWTLFYNNAVSGTVTLLGDKKNLVATPKAMQVNTLTEFFTILATCIRTEKIRDPKHDVNAWLVKPDPNIADAVTPAFNFNGTSFTQALAFFENRDMLIVFGKNYTKPGVGGGSPTQSGEHSDYQGGIEPTCGSVVLPVPTVNKTQSPGAWLITEAYYDQFLETLWAEAWNTGGFDTTNTTPTMIFEIGSNLAVNYMSDGYAAAGIPHQSLPYPTTKELLDIRDNYQTIVDDALADGVAEQIANGDWSDDLKALGWGGAAIWYNKIAQLNGGLVAASYKIPYVKDYPKAMENVLELRKKNSASISGYERFNPVLAKQDTVQNADSGELAEQKALYQAQVMWKDTYEKSTTNPLIDTIKAVFGLDGLFNMVDNADTHPLAQLTAIGKSLVESSIRNVGLGFGASAVGGVISALPLGGAVGGAMSVVGSFVSTIGLIGLGVGFVLFYIIPLLPFIYYFFAVGGWIKGIFEAMVGVPLWALAHIRIDGEGLPGDAAMNGYYLIFEIFLRPILIVFGLLGSIVIFAAQVKVLNEIWSLVTSNLSGVDTTSAKATGKGLTGAVEFIRGAVDQFFFTVIYAIVVYLLAMASFKMINLVPNHILRWMGASVQTFGDQSGDPADNLVRNTMLGSSLVTQNIGGAAKGVGAGAGNTLKQLAGRGGE